MTQMQSPYQDQSDVTLYQEPERTSIMAILSMIFGIGGCCLGVTSIPAILLGIFGLVGIAKSKGRVGGTGFGIAGILIGLLTLALWGSALGAVSYGFGWMEKNVAGPTAQILLDIEAGRFDAARGAMGAPGSDVSDEQMIAFRDAYTGVMGGAVSETHGVGELFMGYAEVGQQVKPYQGRPNHIPVPIVFDSGMGLVAIEFDATNPTVGNSQVMRPIRLIVVDADGNEYLLPSPDWIDSSGETDPSPETDDGP